MTETSPLAAILPDDGNRRGTASVGALVRYLWSHRGPRRRLLHATAARRGWELHVTGLR